MMSCDQVKELLMPFADGELEPEMAAEVQAAMVDCADCQAELAGLGQLSALARETFEAPAMEIDLSGVYDGVMARIEASEATAIEGVKVERSVETEGFMDRAINWCRDLFTFEQPMVTIGSFAVLALLVGGIYWTQSGVVATPGAPGPDERADKPEVEAPDQNVATAAPTNNNRRDADNGASQVATIDGASAAHGVVKIEISDDPDIPAIVWHTIEGEEAPAEDPEL